MIEPDPFLTVIVWGTPIPQGSKAPGQVVNGHSTMRDDNKEVLARWRKDIVRAIGVPAERCLAGPVRAVVTFGLQPPATMPKDRIGYPSVRPDLDKYQRALGDAFTTSSVIHDDGQIVEWYARKLYVGHPACHLAAPGVIARLYRLTS